MESACNNSLTSYSRSLLPLTAPQSPVLILWRPRSFVWQRWESFDNSVIMCYIFSGRWLRRAHEELRGMHEPSSELENISFLVLAFSILSIYHILHNWCQNIKFILILIDHWFAVTVVRPNHHSFYLFENKFPHVHSQSPTTVTICLAILKTISGKLPSLHTVTFPARLPRLVRELSSIPWWASRDDRRKSPRHPFSAIVSSIWVPLMQNGKLSEILLSW